MKRGRRPNLAQEVLRATWTQTRTERLIRPIMLVASSAESMSEGGGEWSSDHRTRVVGLYNDPRTGDAKYYDAVVIAH
jgi:hypothetical protein